MSIYSKFFPGCVVLISSIAMISCSQSGSDLPDTTGAAVVPTTTVSADVTGAKVALSKTDVQAYEGDTLTLDIMMSDIEMIEGGGVSLSFDPALLEVSSVTVDSAVWGFKNKNGVINNVQGSVSDILFSSYQGVSGDARLATVEFKCKQKGSGKITLRESLANKFAGAGQTIDVAFTETNVTSN